MIIAGKELGSDSQIESAIASALRGKIIAKRMSRAEILNKTARPC